jgi:hypothetical protein
MKKSDRLVVVQNSGNRRRNEEKCLTVMEGVAYDTAVHMKMRNPQTGRNKKETRSLLPDDSLKTISRKVLSCHRKSRIFQIYRSSSVVVVTGLPARGLRNSSSSPRQGKEIFIYPKPLYGVWGTVILLLNIGGGFFLQG